MEKCYNFKGQRRENDSCVSQTIANILASGHAKSLQLYLSATLWTVATQASLSIGFSKGVCWGRLSCSPPGDLPKPRIEPTSHVSHIGRRVLYHQCHLRSPDDILNLQKKRQNTKVNVKESDPVWSQICSFLLYVSHTQFSLDLFSKFAISFSFSFYFSSYLSHLNYATVLNFFISALSSENIYWFLHLLPEGHTP